MNLILTTRAEGSLRWQRAVFYAQRDHAESLLAKKVRAKIRNRNFPRIRSKHENYTSNPRKVMEEFEGFFLKLYEENKMWRIWRPLFQRKRLSCCKKKKKKNGGRANAFPKNTL